MTNTQLGILVGFIAGVAWVAIGFSAMLAGIILATIGYTIGRVLDRQVDLQGYIERFSRG